MSPRALVTAVLAIVAAAMMPSVAQADPAGSPGVGAFLDVGGAHGCAVQVDAAVRCWGKGSSGRLGARGLSDRLAAPGTEAATADVGPAVAVDTGGAHTCVITVSSAVRCWGQGGAGQLGSGTRDNRLDGTVGVTGTDDATQVSLGSGATAIAAGAFFTCALTTARDVRCWGQGAFGALGSRGTDNRLDGLGAPDEASVVPLGGPVKAVSAGSRHACALLVSGAVRCWGSGADGRLGSGAIDDRLDGLPGPAGTDEASTVPLGEAAVAVAAGGSHTCALMTSGSVACWGAGTQGQLGSGDAANLLDEPGESPSTVVLRAAASSQGGAAGQRAVAITAGASHSCAITADGEVRCWGEGDRGQLGQGATDSRLDADAEAPGDAASHVGRGPSAAGPGLGAPAAAISAADDTTCALLATGVVRCWGEGAEGRLGSLGTDARLDGVVDPVTRTDDASTVPLGRVALTTPPLPDLAVPTPEGSTATPAAPSVSVPSAATPTAPPPVAGPGARSPNVTFGEKAAPPVLSFRLRVKARSATVAAMLRSTKPGRCPSRARGVLRQGRATLAKVVLVVTTKNGNCRAAAAFRLSTGAKRTGTVVLTIRAPGLAARRLPAAM